ncbi:hypothetical protein E4K72_04910 [Oxalobacteraceae bacterium OM1]|nr:hypothetical protein E4K72_04910 [Oxalobacteraceae bacterium OM1]
MSHLDLLLPFALPPTEIAPDLLKELDMPALAHLLSRTRPESDGPRVMMFDGYARALPHEAWLAGTFGLAGDRRDSSPPVASAWMRVFGHEADAGCWFVVQPVHIHIARDHLVLTDTRALTLSETDARTLFDIAREVFAEAGKTLMWGNASAWFLRADDWAELSTATPDAATGHNVDIWMPHGPCERDWRKLQNEVQMLWFAHDINQRREAAGERMVNSIWLWGAATPRQDLATAPYTHAFNLQGWTEALRLAVKSTGTASDARQVLVQGEKTLVLLDDLLAPALANDWGTWLSVLQQFEDAWFTPLLEALRAGHLDSVRVLAGDAARLARFSATRGSLRKFWIKPALSPLLT